MPGHLDGWHAEFTEQACGFVNAALAGGRHLTGQIDRMQCNLGKSGMQLPPGM